MGILFFVPLFTVFAENISVMVVEAGDGAIAAQGVADLWEEGIMDVFFREGHIVSNARSKRIKKNPGQDFPEEALRDLQEAAEGGAKYFVLAILSYNDIVTDANAKPEIMSLKLYQVNPYALLFEEILEKKKMSYEEETNQIRNAAKAVVSYIRRTS